jgi:protein O-mannosyl-transferase
MSKKSKSQRKNAADSHANASSPLPLPSAVPATSDKTVDAPPLFQKCGGVAGGGANSGSWWNTVAIAALAAIALAAYSYSFNGVFLFDDVTNIVESPPHLATPWWVYLETFYIAGMRNLVSLSLIANYAAAGFQTWGYHAFNLAVHLISGLALFGFMRRTLLTPRLRAHLKDVSTPVAFGVAALFLVHPLQTESVTYIIQRAQSMMGMFQFLAMYCVVRGFESPRKYAWHFAALLCCVFGLDVKPHLIAMPILILLYDRTFFSSSLRAALWRSKLLYAGLLWVWVINVGNLSRDLKNVDIGSRGANPEAASGDMSVWEYASSQFFSICLYLKLSFWPHPLCLDYALPVARTVSDIVPYAIAVLTLGFATLWGIRRFSAWGFIGAWFFLNLGPSSSIIRRPDLAVEHRMYVPLAAIIVAQVLGVFFLIQYLASWQRYLLTQGRAAVVQWAILALAIVGFSVLTFRRNIDYCSTFAMWSDTVRQNPNNPRAQNNLGLEYYGAGNIEEAEKCYEKALRANPDYWQSIYNMGMICEHRGQNEQALEKYNKVLGVDYKPLRRSIANVRNNLGLQCRNEGKLKEAEAEFHASIASDPEYWQAQYNLGLVLATNGDFPGAITAYKRAAELNPSYSDANTQRAYAEFGLAEAFANKEQWDLAIEHYTEVIRLAPGYRDAVVRLADAYAKQRALDLKQQQLAASANALAEASRNNPADSDVRYRAANAYNDLGLNLRDRNRLGEAEAQFKTAINLYPEFWPAHFNMGLIFDALAKSDEALSQYREALRLAPSVPMVRSQVTNALNNAGLVLRAQSNFVDAEKLFREAVSMDPAYWQAHFNLALVLQGTHQIAAAVQEYKETLTLNPTYTDAKKFLDEAEREMKDGQRSP